MLNTKLRGLKIKIAKDLDDILKFAEYWASTYKITTGRLEVSPNA